MKQIADWALGMAAARGASHAEARIVNERGRSLGTRNGRVAVASEGESLGLGIRVLANGGWGFAATQELTQAGVERCAALAVEIAKASARVQRQPVQLLPEPAAVAEWSSPCKIDPFAVSIEENFELLRKIDATLTAVPGVTLAPLEPEIAVASTRLPFEMHADPADRILVATARHLGAALVTADKALLELASLEHFVAMDAAV